MVDHMNTTEDFLLNEQNKDTNFGESKPISEGVNSTTEINYSDLWLGMMRYYKMGLSMIWSRLEAEVINNIAKPPKSPIGKWKSAQEVRFTEGGLSSMMHKARVSISPAIVCGKVSGNLEVIDVDVKHWPGIDALFFSEISKLYPDLFKKLRIHKTMSGGFHVLYQGEEPFNEGNKKLACQKGFKEAGIETRGEGGIILCPPGKGYTVYQDVPIPTISKVERDSLITLARIFDENTKFTFPKKVKSYESKYSENPFDHYNSSTEAEQILLEHGWSVYSDTSNFIHYTKPDKKISGVSASWIKNKRVYHIFTTGSELEPDKFGGNYSPSSVLIQLKFKGDSKTAYKYLVDSGYGKLQHHYEDRQIKTYAQFPDKVPPANFSSRAKEKIKEERLNQKNKYPYGIFWAFDEDLMVYKISLTRIIEVGNELGIARFNNNLIHIEKPYFRFIEENECQAILSKYIKEERDDYIKINDTLLKTWKQYSDFLTNRTEVREISRKEVLRSSEMIQYKVFLNGVLEITSSGYEISTDLIKYGKLICSDDIIQSNFVKQIEEEFLTCKYVQFLQKAISNDLKYIQKCIGSLCSDFKSRGKGYLIAALEAVTKMKGSGSGKGIFFEMLGDRIHRGKNEKRQKKWTTVLSVNGNLIKNSSSPNMLQSWNGEKIVHFSDVPRTFDLSDLKDMITDGGQVKKLYKDLANIDAEDFPNFGLSSQWAINIEHDPGVKRRARILAFTSYFNVNHEVRDEFGGSFPHIWDENDWIGYYNFIAAGICIYLFSGKIEVIKDPELIWEKKFDENFGGGNDALRNWMPDMLQEWVLLEYVKSSDLLESYNNFCSNNNIIHPLSIPRLHNAFEDWCDRHGFEYEHSVVKRPNGGDQCRCIVVNKKQIKLENESHENAEPS